MAVDTNKKKLYQFRTKKHPILFKLGAFYNNLFKIHQIYAKLGAFVCDENPRSLYQSLRKSIPKGKYIYVHRVNLRTPLPGLGP